MEKTQNVEALSRSEKVLKEIESQKLRLDELNPIRVDGYGEEYEANVELRIKFPNSYFLNDIYDNAIYGVNIITESIIYKWELLCYYYALHIEGMYPDLGDRIECAGIVIARAEKLTKEELQGKVRPSFIFNSVKMDNWGWVKENIS